MFSGCLLQSMMVTSREGQTKNVEKQATRTPLYSSFLLVTCLTYYRSQLLASVWTPPNCGLPEDSYFYLKNRCQLLLPERWSRIFPSSSRWVQLETLDITNIRRLWKVKRKRWTQYGFQDPRNVTVVNFLFALCVLDLEIRSQKPRNVTKYRQ